MLNPAFVLVHGSWHGPWCWAPLEEELRRRGAVTRTVALPSCDEDRARWAGLDGDARAVEEGAAAVDGPVVVVAHSYAGVVASAAAMPPNVRSIVFLGAFMPDRGRSLVSYLPEGEPPPPFARFDGPVSHFVAEAAPAHFYNTCAPEVAAAATARLRDQDIRAISAPVGEPSWRSVPSDYVVLTQDRVLPVPLQERFATQARRRHALDTDHSPFLCAPGRLADLLLRIAA